MCEDCKSRKLTQESSNPQTRQNTQEST